MTPYTPLDRATLRRLVPVALWLAATFTATAAPEDWTKPFRNADNNAVLNAPAPFDTLPAAPAWQTGDQSLASDSAPIIVGQTLYATGQYGLATDTDATDDFMSIKAFDAETGTFLWESPKVACGISVSYWSNSGPTADPATGVLYLGAGQRVYKIDAQTHQTIDSIQIDETNTSPTLSLPIAWTGAWNIVNAAPALGAGLVFIETYGGFNPENKQIVALRQSDMKRVWYKNDKGNGTGTPCFVDNGTSQCVYTGVQKGVACYDAANGAEIWNSLKLAAPWSTDDKIIASVVHAGGKIFAVSDSFSTTGTLVCADAATGARQWQAAVPSSSNPPVVIGNRVFVYGGAYGTGRLGAFNATDGTRVFIQSIGAGNYNSYLAAAQNRIYVTDGAKLIVTDLDGNVLGTKNGYNGAVALDRRGGLYVRAQGAVHAFGQTVPVELTTFMAE